MKFNYDDFGHPKTKLFLSTAIIILSLFGCGPTPSNRETEKQQNQADSAAERKDLQPALGRFEGQMLMTVSRRKFDVVLETKIIYHVIPSPKDPTLNISVPRLSGYLKFPLLQNLSIFDLVPYSEVTNALGGFILAGIDMGDYDSNTQTLNLPYSVAKFGKGPFGSFQGELIGGAFVGKWNSRVQSQVGTFNLVRVEQTNE